MAAKQSAANVIPRKIGKNNILQEKHKNNVKLVKMSQNYERFDVNNQSQSNAPTG